MLHRNKQVVALNLPRTFNGIRARLAILTQEYMAFGILPFSFRWAGLKPFDLPDFVSFCATRGLNLHGSTLLPINARAIGEVTEIFPLFASASGSPTICHTRLVRPPK
jgi:hypothetical protein